jgi:hypothetical protein
MMSAALAKALPTPTVETIEAECREFDAEPYTKLSEEALGCLREAFPRNAQVSHVLLKVIALNRLYSTRVNDVDIWPLANHIAGLGIDDLIERGDPSAVWRVYSCENLRMYYSFATKFCSWHNPRRYPIYDRNADECLWAYKKHDGFADFRRQDLGYYEKLITIVDAFRKHYSLDRFSFKEIDKFLWRTGAKILERTVPQGIEAQSG